MIGRTLGHYRIVEKIGAGGMGEVYGACDERLQRDVALKVLPPAAVGDDASRRRLLREAQTASSLNHPHICTIYEVGESGNEIYIAMERVEGRSLRSLIPPEGLPVETALRYGIQIADAVAHADEHGIVHRDIKSANVMVTSAGQVKVLDFGLAKKLSGTGLSDVTRSAQTLNEPGGAAGTLAYMAPEVLRGEAADWRSDIWSLGGVLYEMLAGKLPFGGQTAIELSSAILREPAPPLPTHVPAALRAIVQRCLVKEPGERYQRAGEVRAALEAVHVEATGSTAVASVSGSSAKAGRRSLWILAVAGGLILLGALVAANVGWLRERIFHRAPSGSIHSLAVLPFRTVGVSGEESYLGFGMADTLTTKLSALPQIAVRPARSAMRFERSDVDPVAAGREMAVDSVLDGEIQKSGNRIRVTVQLVGIQNGATLWADQFDEDFTDLFAVEDSISQQVTDRLAPRLTGQEKQGVARPITKDSEAYQAYMQGRYLWNKGTEEPLTKSIQYFQRAIERDPEFALAYAAIAEAYTDLAVQEYIPATVAFSKSKAAATKALQIEPGLAEPHTALGMVAWDYDWDWAEADRQLNRALELNPASANAHARRAFLLMTMRRFEEAIGEAKKAMELDPTSGAPVGYAYFAAQRYQESATWFTKALELDPDNPFSRAMLAAVYAFGGNRAQALAEYAKMRGTALSAADPFASAIAGYACAISGRRDDAEAILAQLRKVSKERYVDPYIFAMIYSGLNEKEQAMQWIVKAYEERSGSVPFMNFDPFVQNLQSDPRFQDIVRQAGLPN